LGYWISMEYQVVSIVHVFWDPASEYSENKEAGDGEFIASS